MGKNKQKNVESMITMKLQVHNNKFTTNIPLINAAVAVMNKTVCIYVWINLSMYKINGSVWIH